ncbi:hypothetical protein DA11_07420 [Aeromonas caviae]|nr:hypothetical protein DA11_07420 [Aeromonas caviae]
MLPAKSTSHPGQALGLAEQHDMTRGVARAEIDLQLAISKLNLVPLGEPAIRVEGRGMGKADIWLCWGQDVEPEGIFPVGADNADAGASTQLGGGPHVIQVAMGQDDLHQPQLVPGDGGQQFVRLATGSINAAWRVSSHQMREQFWANWVTGITRTSTCGTLLRGLKGERLAKKRGRLLVTTKQDPLALVVQLIAVHGVIVASQQQSDPDQMGAGVPALGLFPEGGLQQPIEFAIILVTESALEPGHGVGEVAGKQRPACIWPMELQIAQPEILHVIGADLLGPSLLRHLHHHQRSPAHGLIKVEWQGAATDEAALVFQYKL